jgi:hypothetical protein
MNASLFIIKSYLMVRGMFVLFQIDCECCFYSKRIHEHPCSVAQSHAPQRQDRLIVSPQPHKATPKNLKFTRHDNQPKTTNTQVPQHRQHAYLRRFLQWPEDLPGQGASCVLFRTAAVSNMSKFACAHNITLETAALDTGYTEGQLLILGRV